MMGTLLFLLLLISCAFGQQLSVSGFECIPIDDCPSLRKLMQKRPVSLQAMEILKLSHCGYVKLTPRVWCPKVEAVTEGVTETSIDLTPLLKVPESTNLATPNLEEKKKLLPTKCGRQDNDDRILGGDETDLGEFPWAALLMYKNDRSGDLFPGCGGVLISERYVLTAAHCLDRIGVPDTVVLGEHDYTKDPDCIEHPFGDRECAPPSVSVGIESAIIHSEWKVAGKRSFYHDIGILRLAKPVNFTEFITPICIATNETEVRSQRFVITAGWGNTENNTASNVKRKVSLPVTTNEQCTRALTANIMEGQICAGGVKNKDSCKGDSGGPLMYRNRFGNWLLAGIVSLGPRGCGRLGAPAIYTLIPRYLDWIYQQLEP